MFAGFAENVKSFPPASCIYNLAGSSTALFLALQEKPFIMVEPTEEAAEELYKDILFFRSIIHKNIFSAPPRPLPLSEGVIFFLPEPDGPEICGQRAEVIYNFKEGDSIVISKSALNAEVWMTGGLKNNVLRLKRHFEVSRDLLEQRLIKLGYKRVSLVAEHGEFSRRGWLFDVFPSTANEPLRIEFFGDAIETIRTFDIGTQKSIREKDEFIVMPASEPLDGTDVFSVIGKINCFYSDSVHPPFEFFGSSRFRPDGAVMLSRFSFPMAQHLEIPPHSHLKKGGSGGIAEGGRREVAAKTDESRGIDAGLLSMGGCGIYHNERKSIYEFPDAVKKFTKDNTVIIVASSAGQAERIKEILVNGDVIAPVIEKGGIDGYEGNIAITTGGLSAGFFIHGLMILTEKEIFGGRPAYRPIKKTKVTDLLLSLDDLAVGDYVVHKDHGIGKFSGLVKQTVDGHEGDLMVVEYSGGDRLYLPLYRINSIKKYHAEEGIVPKIDRLGGKTWQKTKERVGKKIRETAEKLLRLYAEREVSKGFSFSADTEIHREFDGFFIYEETPDQLRAIEEIKSDMESVGDPSGRKKPMDRLLCGDVGYGKTEVAIRAAFKAVYDGKQVIVLAPTTLLCEQHYRTFKQRFSAFPVTIDYLSRFKTKKEQRETIERVMKGDIDILIGTHALLGKGIKFHNPGLLVIDEEHRFGVAQKERIKELKAGVDVLTLTATPIPRTLNLALSGIRGMSLIETPPEERLSVRSIAATFDEQIIKDAIERELERNGQTFFVHNRITDIGKILKYLERLFPDARISVAHGRMRERELENIMRRFINGEIDVLVSTSIIGSGLDIPNANTIIINRADRMGLADLYQLRGRVGRSNVRAYAYFIIPGEDIITDEAKKRLQAVQDMSYLGAGFRLAMKDLEIRGAGNMLGPQQSGHIHAVGFDMYIEMLEKSVAELKGIEVKEDIEPHISVSVSAYIPEMFVEDIMLRLSIYRRIASARDHETLNILAEEIKDRFGALPVEVRNLFDVMRLKISAKNLMIVNIDEINGNIRVIFSREAKVAAEKILGLPDSFGGRIRFLQEGFEIKARDLSWDERYRLATEILGKLS